MTSLVWPLAGIGALVVLVVFVMAGEGLFEAVFKLKDTRRRVRLLEARLERAEKKNG